VKGAPRSKVPLIIAGVVGAVLLIGVVALVLGSGGSDKKSGPAANPAGQIVGKPIPTGKDPSDLAFGGGAVWTANLSDGTVTRIDPATSKTTSIKVGGFPVEVDFDNNMLFVWNGTSTIVKVDPATNQVVGGPIDTGGKIDSVAAGAGSVWVTHSADNTVTRIDEKTGQIDGNPIKVGKAPQGIAFGEGAVWVANSQDKTLTKIDAGLGKVFDAPVALGDSPGGVSVADGVVYVGTTSDVTQVDPQSLTLDQPIPLKGAAFYSVGHGALWATYPTRGQLQRIDVDTKKEIGQPIKVGRRAQGVAVGDHDVPDVWIVNTKANSVTRVKP
jgi:DNA-binding beta-propeller fold protein YncE